jgi:hypothetical protein
MASIGLTALLRGEGCEIDELEPVVVILTEDFPNPTGYPDMVLQARSAIERHRTRIGLVESALSNETVDGSVVPEDVVVEPICEICNQIIVFESDHIGRLHEEHENSLKINEMDAPNA